MGLTSLTSGWQAQKSALRCSMRGLSQMSNVSEAPKTRIAIMTNHASAYTSRNAISFPGLLSIVFIALKLTGYITWSWLWVFPPIWLPIAVVAGFFAIAASVMFIALFIANLLDRK